MLLLHEVHTVAGRHEEAFEAAYRETLDAHARQDRRHAAPLLPEARARHRTRVPPRRRSPACATATRTSARRRVQTGDLRSWAADVDRYRHEVKGKLLLPVDWSPMRDDRPRNGARPTAANTTTCCSWRTARGRTRRSSTSTSKPRARTTRRASSNRRSARCSRCSRVFQAALGAPRRREVMLWQRVDFPERLPGLFTRELPPHVKGPGN